MLQLNANNLMSPKQLRRLVALADIDIKKLTLLTGLGESTINNYLNDGSTRHNYLFQFALEFLAQETLNKLLPNEK